jgi:hypothetical protein
MGEKLKRVPALFAILTEFDSGYMQNSFTEYTRLQELDKQVVLALMRRDAELVRLEDHRVARLVVAILEKVVEENEGNFDSEKVRAGLFLADGVWRRRERLANDEEEPLLWDELTAEEAEERCELCVHQSCMREVGDTGPGGPGAYCDNPFLDN